MRSFLVAAILFLAAIQASVADNLNDPLLSPEVSILALPDRSIEITIHDRSADEDLYRLVRFSKTTGRTLLHSFAMPDSGSMLKVFDETIPLPGLYDYEIELVRNKELLHSERIQIEVPEEETSFAFDDNEQILNASTEVQRHLTNDGLIRLLRYNEGFGYVLDVDALGHSNLNVTLLHQEGGYVRVIHRGWVSEQGKFTLLFDPGDYIGTKVTVLIELNDQQIKTELPLTDF